MLILSKHAKQQARERGISITEIKTAIQSGVKYIQEPNKIVAEYGYIKIIYRELDGDQFVITVMIR